MTQKSEPRTKQILLKLTEQEHEDLVKNAKKTGLTKSKYLRVLLSERLPQYKPCDKFWAILENYYLIDNMLYEYPNDERINKISDEIAQYVFDLQVHYGEYRWQ